MMNGNFDRCNVDVDSAEVIACGSGVCLGAPLSVWADSFKSVVAG